MPHLKAVCPRVTNPVSGSACSERGSMNTPGSSAAPAWLATRSYSRIEVPNHSESGLAGSATSARNLDKPRCAGRAPVHCPDPIKYRENSEFGCAQRNRSQKGASSSKRHSKPKVDSRPHSGSCPAQRAMRCSPSPDKTASGMASVTADSNPSMGAGLKNRFASFCFTITFASKPLQEGPRTSPAPASQDSKTQAEYSTPHGNATYARRMMTLPAAFGRLKRVMRGKLDRVGADTFSFVRIICGLVL